MSAVATPSTSAESALEGAAHVFEALHDDRKLVGLGHDDHGVEAARVHARADPSDSAMAAAADAYLDVARGLGLGKAEALRYLEAYEGG